MRATLIAIPVVCVLAIAASGFAAEPVRCAVLLTEAEVRAAAGAGFQNLGQEASEGGKSECIWLVDRRPDPKAISLRYQQVTTGLPELFEALASKAEGVHGNPREALDGIGVKAALIPGKKPGAMMVLVVQTADGVGYLETDRVERAEAVALARAVATK